MQTCTVMGNGMDTEIWHGLLVSWPVLPVLQVTGRSGQVSLASQRAAELHEPLAGLWHTLRRFVWLCVRLQQISAEEDSCSLLCHFAKRFFCSVLGQLMGWCCAMTCKGGFFFSKILRIKVKFVCYTKNWGPILFLSSILSQGGQQQKPFNFFKQTHIRKFTVVGFSCTFQLRISS